VTPEDLISAPPGSTPLSEEEKAELIPRAITLRSELNEAEQENILKASIWLSRSKMSVEQLLTAKRLKAIHGRMLGQVWRWANEFRRTGKNIGIAWRDIPTQLDSLCADTLTQIADTSDSKWSNDEIAIRFHHRLVYIHPFINGNGRYARLITDKLLSILGEAEFTWGSSAIDEEGVIRRNYIQALKDADNHDFTALLRFARS
jgi:Fic-DOC domain mobile mystery protein B